MQKRPPLLLFVPAVIAAAGMGIPLFYLLVRSAEADSAVLAQLLLRQRTLTLLGSTASLAVGVWTISLAIAFPLAWITERTELKGRRIIALLSSIPLAVPGYVVAYALLSLGGNRGLIPQIFGFSVARLSGYWGAAIALSLYSFPYLFLNLRTGLAGLDPALEESARSLGYTRRQVFFTVMLPHLRPALLAGSVIILLYVLGDFGVVALMRYETISYAVYTQYTGAFDRTYAAVLSLMLVAISLSVLAAETLLLRNRAFHASARSRRHCRRNSPGMMQKIFSYGFAAAVAGASVFLPLLTLVVWMSRAPLTGILPQVIQGFFRSASAAVPAAAGAVLLAVPIAYLHARHHGRLADAAERTAFIGYAVPPMALALAFTSFSIRYVPWLYQSLVLLIAAYSLNFLALAMGPVRSSIIHAPRSLEEAARSMGRTAPAAVMQTTIPLMRKGMAASFMLVFVMSMKELPIALMLSPPGYTTLSAAVFSRTSEAMFTEAAPYAAALVLLSGLVLGITLRYEGETHASA